MPLPSKPLWHTSNTYFLRLSNMARIGAPALIPDDIKSLSSAITFIKKPRSITTSGGPISGGITTWDINSVTVFDLGITSFDASSTVFDNYANTNFDSERTIFDNIKARTQRTPLIYQYARHKSSSTKPAENLSPEKVAQVAYWRGIFQALPSWKKQRWATGAQLKLQSAESYFVGQAFSQSTSEGFMPINPFSRRVLDPTASPNDFTP
jgi:hypothetical protein